ncbi:arginyl-tRNA synthetase [Podospora appendiculata]|uniref:arginine--tRNA ligase n=1 Tax=Podospora appendiculata TaxID=314037 RepID=A0AAE0XBQ8_9PEZI|nr:arginyl-tRNA synthetase [Podospora appendiculata]
MATTSLDALQGLLENLGLEDPIPPFTSCDVLTRPLDIFHSYLADILVKIAYCEPQVAYDAIQWATDMNNGDLDVVVPKLRIKTTDNKELTRDLAEKFPQSSLFSLPLADGIHLRVFFLSKSLPKVLLPYIHDRKETYGIDTAAGLRDPATSSPDASAGTRKKVVVEFSSPNIGAKFEGAHLRSTLIGSYIASMHEAHGWDVVRLNYLGDWGKQLGLLAAGWTRFGSDELFAADPLRHLLDVYLQIEELFRPEQEARDKLRDEKKDTAEIESQGLYAERDGFFKKMEDGDADALALWTKFRDVSIESYRILYAAMNVTFDEYAGESQVNRDIIAEVEATLREKGFLEESDGSWLIDYKKHGHKGLSTAILRGRTGSTTYLLRDIAAAVERDRKYAFDKMVYVVKAEQESHFQRIFAALEMMGLADLRSRLEHVSFAKCVDLGETALLSDIIGTSQSAARIVIESDPDNYASFPATTATPTTADRFGIAALQVQEMLVRRNNNTHFSADRMVSLEVSSGARLQYWYGRLCAALQGATPDLEDLDYALLVEEDYTNLLRVMTQFPDIVQGAFRTMEATGLLTYLFRIVDQISVILEDEEDEEEAGGASSSVGARLALLESVRLVLRNGMGVLGVEPVLV